VPIPWGPDTDYDLEVRVFRCPQRRSWAAHAHAEHELIWAPAGTVLVDTAGACWRVGGATMLLLPGGVEHAVIGEVGAMFFCVFVRATRPVEWTAPTPMVTTVMLQQLLEYLSLERLSSTAREHAESVVFDVLEPQPTGTAEIPMPFDARARRVAEALIANPADGRSLAAWAEHVGAGARTLTRLFVAEVGMPFMRWRTMLRVQVASGLLESGISVSRAAHEVGFATPSAFSESFRGLTGISPREHQQRSVQRHHGSRIRSTSSRIHEMAGAE
jgi:AraC-like DNA-binding protein